MKENRRRNPMSKKDSAFQKVFMSFMFRGKEIFKPLNTGWIDERVGAVREWVANVFFYNVWPRRWLGWISGPRRFRISC